MCVSSGNPQRLPKDPFHSYNHSVVDNISYLKKAGTNLLKKAALAEGNKIIDKVIDKVNEQVKILEEDNKASKPKGLFGRFKTTPAEEKINKNKKIQKKLCLCKTN